MTDGQEHLDTQHSDADLDRIHASLGHFARYLWDVQKQRIAASNRFEAMVRDDVVDADADHPLKGTVLLYAQIEKDIEKVLVAEVRRHFMADWIADQRGIGLPGFARLLGITGSIDRFPTVSKLWKYLGLHVVDGHAPKREKGVPWTHTDCTFGHLLTCTPDCTTDHHPNCVPGGIGTAYAPQGRVVCHQLGESISKLGYHKKPCAVDCEKQHKHRASGCLEDCLVDHAGPYRRAYDQKKAYYEAERPDWTQARRHNAAMRYAVKELIKNLWIEWHARRGQVCVDTQKLHAAPDVATREPALV